MARNSNRSILFAVSIAAALVAVLALVVGGVLGAARPQPSAPPGSQPPAPSQRPSPSLPSVTPSPRPSDDASDGIDVVDLITVVRIDYSALVWDESDSLADASSGEPGRGASVGPDEVGIEHVDADAIRLTWTDLPIQNQVRVSISRDGDGRYVVRIVRPRPQMPTDGDAADRVLVLDFHVAVPAKDLRVEIVDTLVPSGELGFARVALGPTQLAVWDETQGLAAVVGAGSALEASVGPDEVAVVNLDDSTIRVVWTELPIESQTRLSIRMDEDGTYRLRLHRTHSQEPTDGDAGDRFVVLKFHVSVAAEDVAVEIVDSLRNDG